SGGSGMGPIYKLMLRRPLQLAISLLPSLFSPKRVKRILEVLSYGHSIDGAPEAELLSIAVDPAFRGQGISDALYCALVVQFRNRGVQSFRITVGDKLSAAHRFYQRMGAEPSFETQV